MLLAPEQCNFQQMHHRFTGFAYQIHAVFSNSSEILHENLRRIHDTQSPRYSKPSTSLFSTERSHQGKNDKRGSKEKENNAKKKELSM